MLLMERRFRTYAVTGVWPKRIPVKTVIDVKYNEVLNYERLFAIKTDNGWTTRLVSWQHKDFDQILEDEGDGSEPDWR